jgi:hypothetical protein
MADLGPLDDVWRRSLDAYIKYYSTIGRLTADYLKDLAAAWSDVRLPTSAGGAQPMNATPTVVTQPPGQPSPAPHAAGVMVLEGEAGAGAVGVFLVENNLGQEVSGRVIASAFIDETGREIRPAFVYDPEIINLRPGEQLLVRVLAAIDETMEPEVRYQGQFTIPELSGTMIPIVLRRRPNSVAAPTEETQSELTEKTEKTNRPTRARSTQPKRPRRAIEKKG